MAEEKGCVGLANFLQDRIDIHFKHDWMLRSINKAQ
jgi:DNA-binding ferritin-like protein